MFELNNDCHHTCFYCDNKLQIKDFYFYGWRSLYECHCTICQVDFLIDLPIFSGIPYPCIYDKNKKQVLNKVAPWWGTPLENIILNINDKDVISDIKLLKKRKKVILFNLSDIVYGHAFMRLEKLTYYIDNCEYKDFDLLVLIPKQLRYLIANFKDKVSIIEIDLKFPEYKQFYTHIDKIVKQSIKEYKVVYCEMLKYPQQEFLKLEQLNLPISKWIENVRKVIIVYRKDRTIGINRRHQYYFYKKLINKLKSLNSIEIYMIGDKDGYSFNNINDMRVDRFDEHTDVLWNDVCSGAITLGVHGSNLLVPSLCSSYNIEFVNYEKLYHLGQATAFLDNLNQQETIQKYRYIYGNDSLSDIKPELVYQMIKSIIIRMNFTFNAVREEKYGDINSIRQQYDKSNSALYEKSFYQKIMYKVIQVRKRINL